MSMHEICKSCFRNVTEWKQPCQYEMTCNPSDGASMYIAQADIDAVDTQSQDLQVAVDKVESRKEISGSTAHYYEIPVCTYQLQDLISYLNCNAQLGEIGRAWMRYGKCPHSSKKRDLEKIIFYAQAELERLVKYES